MIELNNCNDHPKRAQQRKLYIQLFLVSVCTSLALVIFPATVAAATPPSFSIINPKYNGSASGPVKTDVTISAAGGWKAKTNITLSVTSFGASCTSNTIPATPDATITVNDDGSFTGAFLWPIGVNQPGTYAVCASDNTNTNASSNAFTVLSSSNGSPSAAPLLSIQTTAANTGDKITVTGANWLPPSTQVQLYLQDANSSQDKGELLVTTVPTTISDGNGNFQAEVTLPLDRISSEVILGLAGPPLNSVYPLTATTKSFTVVLAPTPTATVAPTVVPMPTVGSTTPKAPDKATTSTASTKVLIVILGLIAAVLLIAGIVVAVLALRGRDNQQPPPGGSYRRDSMPDGGPQGWQNQYPPNSDWQSQQSGPPPGWGTWQQPPGQPWSGRESRNFQGDPRANPPSSPFDEDAYDDPYRTRMGDPMAPPPRPTGNLPPGQRPNSTQRPPWNDPNGNPQDTNGR